MRTCRYEDAARQAADAAVEKWARADDAMLMLEWALVRDPDAGVSFSHSRELRAITFDGAKSGGLPTIDAMYEVTDTLIIFHALAFSDSVITVRAGRA